jgi:hypothetical protein
VSHTIGAGVGATCVPELLMRCVWRLFLEMLHWSSTSPAIPLGLSQLIPGSRIGPPEAFGKAFSLLFPHPSFPRC